MQETGVHNGAFGADKFGLRKLKGVNWNFGAPQLCEYSLAAGEAVLSADGALCADTGVFTGRSPKDKFTVRDAHTDKNMWWAGNQSITSEQFEALYADFLAHAEGMTLFAQDLYGGADPSLRIKTRVYTELAWHSLFIRTLLIRPEPSELAGFVPELTIIDLPSFKADPKRHGVRSENVVAIDFARKIVLIGGSYYAGEMKKSVFTTLNYYLPEKGVMPMHCSANVGPDGDSAIFFGLSGTGKTTLSADPNRTLIGIRRPVPYLPPVQPVLTSQQSTLCRAIRSRSKLPYTDGSRGRNGEPKQVENSGCGSLPRPRSVPATFAV